MSKRDLIICLISLILALGLFSLAGSQLDYINNQRSEIGLVVNAMPLLSGETAQFEAPPPSLAFATVALGAFRGLIVDALWIRADRLKSEGQFFDAKQLAEWITILQPRFAAVWEFRSWNMAYNISVAIPVTRPQERWKWVKNGYELLRDKGIPLNPKSISLYRQLALIFQHKIGDVMDEAHKYYKLQLADAIEPLVGGADDKYFEALINAPRDLETILTEPDIAAFIQDLKNADPEFEDNDQLVDKYLTLRQNPSVFEPAAFEIIDRFRTSQALEKFDSFAKSDYLRTKWKLEPSLMHQINKKYGPIEWDDPNTHKPLDWRHPDAHAIYWAVKGLQIAQQEEFDMDEANTDRIVLHSLQNLFRRGKIFIFDSYKPAEQSQSLDISDSANIMQEDVFFRQDLRMFFSYNDAVTAVLDKYEDIPRKGTFESFKNGHRNMLTNAALSFYQSNHLQQASDIYEILRQRYPRKEFEVPLAAFVRQRFQSELKALGIFNAQESITMMLRESYFRFTIRDDDEAANLENLARQVYDYYMSSYSDEERINLPEFRMMKYLALQDFLHDTRYTPQLRQSLLARIRIEKPDLYKQLQQQEQKIIEQMQQEQAR
jgi:hypothetical protein